MVPPRILPFRVTSPLQGEKTTFQPWGKFSLTGRKVFLAASWRVPLTGENYSLVPEKHKVFSARFYYMSDKVLLQVRQGLLQVRQGFYYTLFYYMSYTLFYYMSYTLFYYMFYKVFTSRTQRKKLCVFPGLKSNFPL